MFTAGVQGSIQSSEYLVESQAHSQRRKTISMSRVRNDVQVEEFAEMSQGNASEEERERRPRLWAGRHLRHCRQKETGLYILQIDMEIKIALQDFSSKFLHNFQTSLFEE